MKCEGGLELDSAILRTLAAIWNPFLLVVCKFAPSSHETFN